MTPGTQNMQNTQKKSYAEPQLRVYGDIRQITQTSTTGTGNDNTILFNKTA